jgi:hypothetical protein
LLQEKQRDQREQEVQQVEAGGRLHCHVRLARRGRAD